MAIGVMEGGLRRGGFGAVVSGAIANLAVIGLLWLMALGIVWVAAGAEHVAGALIALAIVAICVPLVGGAAGGFVSGVLSPTRRAIGALHGLVGCGLSFLLITLCSMSLFGQALGAAGNALGTAATASVGATSRVAGSAASGAGGVAGSAERLLTGLGYSGGQAHRMVLDAQRSIQQLLNGQSVNSSDVAAQAQAAANTLMHWFGGAVWIYAGVWLFAMLLAWAFGAVGAERAERVLAFGPGRERSFAGEPDYATTPPFSPQPT